MPRRSTRPPWRATGPTRRGNYEEDELEAQDRRDKALNDAFDAKQAYEAAPATVREKSRMKVAVVATSEALQEAMEELERCTLRKLEAQARCWG